MKRQFRFPYKRLMDYLHKKIPQKQYQILKLGDCFICSISPNTDINYQAIASESTCGASKMVEIAKVKALSELVERMAFKGEKTASVSTGFAAYPYIFNRKRARDKAIHHALNEWVERKSLQQWSSRDDIYCNMAILPLPYNHAFYQGIQSEIKFESYYRIEPLVLDHFPQPVIVYANTQFGWVFGSAASFTVSYAEQNALKELYMNCIGLYRMKTKGLVPTTSYEKQILWISKQERLIQDKLKHQGTASIDIAIPQFRDIKTKYDDCYVVVQAYTDVANQMPVQSENWETLSI